MLILRGVSELTCSENPARHENRWARHESVEVLLRSSVARASDSELLHPASEGIGMHPEDLGRSFGPLDDSSGALQSGDDMSPLGLFQGGSESRWRRLVEMLTGSLGATHVRSQPDRSGQKLPFQLEGRTPREDDRSLDDVLQLADVTRPRVAHQPIHRLSGDRIDLATESPSEARKKELREQRNVRRPFTERRNPKRKDIEAVKKVRPKPSGADSFLQVAIGRRDHPDVHPNCVVAAYRLEFLFLEDAQ